jgi:hypothetical protein
MTVANWPVIAIRIAESMLLFGLIIGAVIAIVIPFAVSAGLGNWNDVTSVANAIVEHWVVLVYGVVVLTVVLVLFIAIHAFVDAGTAQILIDSERSGGAAAFRGDRWFGGGRAAWWPVFWIYNVIWSIAGLVILLPLAATLAGMLAISDNAGRVVIACSGLLVTFLLLVPAGIAAAVWTQKSIVVCVGRNAPATESMRAARQEMMRDFGRHLVVAIIVIIVSIGGAGVISTISMPFSFARHSSDAMSVGFMAPVQIALSFVQSIFSAAVGTWFLASYVALTEER